MTGRVWLLGIVALVGSFLTTFWFTAPGTSNSPLTALASSEVTDDNLSEAAISAGLVTSRTLKGWIDEVSRLSPSQVKIRGWSIDTNEQGMPVTILAFSDGKNVLQTQT